MIRDAVNLPSLTKQWKRLIWCCSLTKTMTMQSLGKTRKPPKPSPGYGPDLRLMSEVMESTRWRGTVNTSANKTLLPVSSSALTPVPLIIQRAASRPSSCTVGAADFGRELGPLSGPSNGHLSLPAETHGTKRQRLINFSHDRWRKKKISLLGAKRFMFCRAHSSHSSPAYVLRHCSREAGAYGAPGRCTCMNSKPFQTHFSHIKIHTARAARSLRLVVVVFSVSPCQWIPLNPDLLLSSVFISIFVFILFWVQRGLCSLYIKRPAAHHLQISGHWWCRFHCTDSCWCEIPNKSNFS